MLNLPEAEDRHLAGEIGEAVQAACRGEPV
jgi:hypothetical protein